MSGSGGSAVHSVLPAAGAAGTPGGPQEPAGGAVLPPAGPRHQPCYGTSHNESLACDSSRSDSACLILTLSPL